MRTTPKLISVLAVNLDPGGGVDLQTRTSDCVVLAVKPRQSAECNPRQLAVATAIVYRYCVGAATPRTSARIRRLRDANRWR